VVVQSVAAESPNTKGIRKGVRIEGLVRGAKPQPLDSPYAFYKAVWELKPGTKLILRVREGGKPADVPVTVGQGARELQPLLSLFVTRPGADKQRDWLGWHPRGMYDASRPQAERYLGWHFNTGKPGDPTAFALIEQYRKDYHKEGLLKHLIARANLDDALKALSKPAVQRPLPPLNL